MKTTSLIAAALLICGAAAAATVEWSFPTDIGTVYYIKADGKGGCALWGATTNALIRVLWLDKSGQALYDQTFPGAVIGFSMGKRGLVYSRISAPTYTTVYVDKKGVETPIFLPAEHTLTAFTTVFGSEVMDRKGFFVCRLPVAPPASVTVVRYNYK
ncbi:hypothetical protein GX586_09380 [bacterium]|nr:hypothetical protein [bacterium]